MTSPTRSRRFSLDLIRALAILSVVFIHAFQAVYGGTPAMEQGGSMPLAAATYLGRLGVPLFLFLSGTLLLNKRFDNEADVVRFYKRSFLPLLLTVEIWCALYTFWLWGTGVEDASLRALIGRLLFFKQLPVTHWWYMPMILGMYLVIPFIAMAVQRVSFKIVAIPLAVISMICVLIPTANGLLEHMGHGPIDTLILDSSFYGGNYGIYLLLGFYLDRRGLIKRVPGPALVIGFALSACLGIYEGFVGIFLWYNNLWILSGALCLFELLRRRDADGSVCTGELPLASRAVVWVSKTSFGIYLCHVMFLPCVQAAVGFIDSIALRSLACSVGLFAVSLAFVSLAQLVPPLRRVLFDMK